MVKKIFGFFNKYRIIKKENYDYLLDIERQYNYERSLLIKELGKVIKEIEMKEKE